MLVGINVITAAFAQQKQNVSETLKFIALFFYKDFMQAAILEAKITGSYIED